MYRSICFFCFVVLFSSFSLKAQTSDTTVSKIAVKTPFQPNPRKAALYSFILPSAGQFYNRKLWYVKVPIVYAGFGVGGYLVSNNTKEYRTFKTAYYNKVNGIADNYAAFSADVLKFNRDAANKARQQSIVFCGIWYLLTAMEAYTAAHLLQFDVSDDLSLQLFNPPPTNTEQNGIGLRLKF